MGRSAIHPGEHLDEQLTALDMSAAAPGRQLNVPANRITEILNGQRAITGDTALRLGHFFGTHPQFLFQGGENATNMLQEQLASTGQPRAACGACEQHHTQFFFQLLDGPRQWRLLNMRSLGSAGEVEFFGHCEEATKMTKFHTPPAVTKPQLVVNSYGSSIYGMQPKAALAMTDWTPRASIYAKN